jgi:WD40 repeat protein
MRNNTLIVAILTVAIWVTPAAASQPGNAPVPIRVDNVAQLQRSGGWDQEQVNHLAWSPNGQTLAIASVADPDVVLRDTQGNIVRLFHGHTAGVRSVAFRNDGLLMASASNDDTARVWQYSTGRLLCTVWHTNQVIAVAFSPTQRVLASSGDDGQIILTNTSTCATIRRWQAGGVVASLAYNRAGTLLASGGQSKTIELWNPNSGSKVRDLVGHTGWVWSLSFSPANNNVLASAGTGDLVGFTGAENTARLWNVSTGQALQMLPSGSFYMLSVAFSSDGTVLATSSRYENAPQANNVRLWDTKTGKLLRELDDTLAWTNAIAFSPDGTILAGGSDARGNSRGGVTLWNIAVVHP